jgi:hypothetical protein
MYVRFGRAIAGQHERRAAASAAIAQKDQFVYVIARFLRAFQVSPSAVSLSALVSLTACLPLQFSFCYGFEPPQDN